MAQIELRDVPDHVYRELSRRAENDGVTISEVVREVLCQEMSRAPVPTTSARPQGQTGRVSREDIVAAVRAARDAA